MILKEFNFFVDFYKLKLNGQIPYRTEWTIYDNIHKVAGTIDMVFRKDDGTFAIYDWKRTKSLFKSFYDKGQSICNQLPEGNFSTYAIQSHIYKKILQDFYGIRVSELFLVQLHPEPYNRFMQATSEDISDEKMKLNHGADMDKLIEKLFDFVKANK